MDLNSINANINRLLTNIWAVISFFKEFAVDGAKDVSITYINADGSESVKTFPNIAKMYNSVEDVKNNIGMSNVNGRIKDLDGVSLTGNIVKIAPPVNGNLKKLRIRGDFNSLTVATLEILVSGHHKTNGANRWSAKYVYQIMIEGSSTRINERISSLEFTYGTQRSTVADTVSIYNGYFDLDVVVDNDFQANNTLVVFSGGSISNLTLELIDKA